jgi:hypothetical protein
MVIRYSTIHGNPYATIADEGLWQGHEIGQGVQNAGCRALEIYHNYIFTDTSIAGNYMFAAGNLLGGTGLVYGNAVAGYNFDVVFSVARNAGSGHQWPDVPAGIGNCGTGTNGNASPWDGNSNSAGYPCLQQTGRGKGDLLSGFPPSMSNTNRSCTPNAATSPPSCSGWPHQFREPWYVWNEAQSNIGSGGGFYGNPVYSGVQMTINRDFYLQISNTANSGCPGACTPFTGATGVGFGISTQRPTTCTAGPGGTYDTSPTGSYGVAYFATDLNGGAGILYVCTALNTWTQVYTRYTYPHPLDTGP